MKPIARPSLEIHRGGGSVLRCGEAAESLRAWLGQGRSVRMAYMDPPFMTGGAYVQVRRVGEQGWRGHRDFVRAGVGYSDRWPGGPGEYLAMMERAAAAVRDLLTDDGCLFLHADWRASADLRVMLDRIFGRDRFVNEIIWGYQSGGRAVKHFSRKHDNILLYRKGKSFYFDPRPIGVSRGPQRRNHMRRGVAPDGRVYYAITSAGREYRYYEDEPIYPGDVWTDIPHLQQKDPERTGYETQKPLALLRRMLLSTTREGDCVCDPFAGSGTTAAAALAEGRLALACDLNPGAVHLCRRRMAEAGRGFCVELDGLPTPGQAAALMAGRSPAPGGTRVTLLSFTVPGGERWAVPSLLPREDTLVDYWSAGRIQGGEYRAHAFEMRTPGRPALSGALTLEDGPGVPAVHVVDALGGEHWFGG